MEYLVTTTTHVPSGTSDEAVTDVRAREAAHSKDLAQHGVLLRLWRPERRGAGGSLPEFFTIFTIQIPQGTPTATVDDITCHEAARAAELAGAGTLTRLWLLPAQSAHTRALGLWRAPDEQQLHTILDSLPMSRWMTVETIPLSVHPSDPALS